MFLPDLPYGASFNFALVRKKLDSNNWEDDTEDDRLQIRRVYLGTIFGITPSGKFYMPFACSNVAGDCPVCSGKGSIELRTGKRGRKRAKRRCHDFSRGVVSRGFMDTPAANRYADRVRSYRHHAARTSDTTCIACDGTGSISAAHDERWYEALEKAAETIGCHVEHCDDSVFISECREKPEDETVESESLESVVQS